MSQFDYIEFFAQPVLVFSDDFKLLAANGYASDRFSKLGKVKLFTGMDMCDTFRKTAFEKPWKKIEDYVRASAHLTENSSECEKIFQTKLNLSGTFTVQIALKKNFQNGKCFWILTGLNVTDQVEKGIKIQKRYQEQLEVFKTLFEMAPIGLAIKDFEGGFYKVNRGLCEIAGYSKEELFQIQPRDLFPEINPKKEAILIQELIEGKFDYFRTEKKLKKSNGTIRIVSETLNLIKDENQVPYIIIVSYLDITEEKDLHQKLVEARNMEELGKLSGGIAHDFNNVLLPVTLCSDIALQEIRSNELPSSPKIKEIESYLQKISVSALRAKTLVQKLFQYSKSGIYELRPILLEKEIPPIIDLLLYEKPPHLGLISEISPGSFPILGELTGVQQVLENLVLNSFHSMKYKEKGSIVVRLFDDADTVVIEVEDEGHGIKDEEMEKIFKPFYSNKNPAEGTGMGLSVVQTIIHKMNGNIRVYSNPGVGTLFQILIPVWKKN
jgi:PAS domain S-box-containing protein